MFLNIDLLCSSLYLQVVHATTTSLSGPMAQRLREAAGQSSLSLKPSLSLLTQSPVLILGVCGSASSLLKLRHLPGAESADNHGGNSSVVLAAYCTVYFIEFHCCRASVLSVVFVSPRTTTLLSLLRQHRAAQRPVLYLISSLSLSLFLSVVYACCLLCY